MAQGFMLHRRRKVVSKAFKTTWNITVGTLSIPSQAGNYNCTVDWGDGTAPTTHTRGSLSHYYSVAGTYQISITGQYTGFRINDNASVKAMLISVDEWGNVGFISMERAFYGCNNLVNLPDGAITGAENVTNFGYCFCLCTKLASIPSGLFDTTPNAKDFEECFVWCSSLTSIPSGLFDKVPNVTDFSDCFRACTSLTSIPSGLFDKVPNATTFSSCFNLCSSLTSVPSGLFDKVPNVTDFSACFYACPLHLPLIMFNYSAIASKKPIFTLCFASLSKTGTAYPLWDYITITSRNYCYERQTALTNYADIPSNWK